MIPSYDLKKIKFATDWATFERAVGLYEGGKVTQFENVGHGFSAIVLGGQPYHVFVSARHYNEGNCDCYLGQEDTLCKHMVALAIRAVTGGEPLNDDDKKSVGGVECSGNVEELSKSELSLVKKSITNALRYIKAYSGPSKTWFAYQNSLDEGCNLLSEIVSGLPVSRQATKLLVDTLLRLDKKLSFGRVDDSNGTVGGLMYQVVDMLCEYVKLVPDCKKEFIVLANKETCFGWEEPLVKILDESED